MKVRQNKDRRAFLSKIGRALLGVLGGGIAASTASGSASAGVFAGRFLKERSPIQLPPGHYDEKTQLFRVTKTGESMFVEEPKSSAVRLSQEELAKLLQNGQFVDISRFPKTKVAAATKCTQTTLKTTSCCPIYTDEESDNISDD